MHGHNGYVWVMEVFFVLFSPSSGLSGIWARQRADVLPIDSSLVSPPRQNTFIQSPIDGGNQFLMETRRIFWLEALVLFFFMFRMVWCVVSQCFLGPMWA